MSQTLRTLKGEVENSTTIVGDFNTSDSIMDGTPVQTTEYP